MNLFAHVLALAIAAVAAGCRSADPRPAGRPPSTPATSTSRVAITVDDLPFVGLDGQNEARVAGTRRLLAAFASRGVPVVAFVNCKWVDKNRPVMALWRQAGIELGNHGHAHKSLGRTDIDSWLEDLRLCHEILTQDVQPDRPARFFRFPYLHQGATADVRQRAADAVARLNYRTAHVTIDSVDWRIADDYRLAFIEGNREQQQQLAEIYRRQMLEAFAFYDRMGREAFGRPVAHVLIMHANLLAADHIGEVLDAFAARGVQFVTLDEALADPIYAERDDYLGNKGVSWLYHARPALLQAWGPREDAARAALEQQLTRLRPRPPRLAPASP